MLVPMAKTVPPVVPAGTMADRDQPQIVIDDGLVLRAWAPDDAPVVMAAFATPDIQRWHFRRFDTEADAGRWIADRNRLWTLETGASWAIVDRASVDVVGRVAIYPKLEDGHGEVSYWVLPSARGRGVATRACVAATDWAHDLGLNRVELQHSIHNAGSRRVALKAGFVEEGVRRGANLHDDGWHDMRLYSHLPTDPPAAPPRP